MFSCNSTESIFNIGQAAILIGSQRDSFPAVAHRLTENFRGATVKEIPLTRNKVALVDDEDFDRIAMFKWYAQYVEGAWYAARTEHIPKPNKPKLRLLHRVLLAPPATAKIIFLDSDGLNCQRSNLHVQIATDLTGLEFGFLRVLRLVGKKKYHKQWLCACTCGQETIVDGANWGKVYSCGCLQRQLTAKRNTTHGMTKMRAYSIWSKMKDRCLNPQCPSYSDYGARGILVCERWLIFENFYADMGDPPDGLTLERKDNNGPYSPDNCRWATRKEQNRNTRRTHFLTFNGVTQCIAAWAEDLDIPDGTISRRIKMNMSIERVLYPGNLNELNRGISL